MKELPNLNKYLVAIVFGILIYLDKEKYHINNLQVAKCYSLYFDSNISTMYVYQFNDDQISREMHSSFYNS